jgi:thioredoxin reductase
MLDCVIVGAGPAGLNAALVLGRCRRNVLVCDSGEPRNARSRGVNGFLTRDGCTPADLRRIGERELESYPSVEVRQIEVTDVDKVEHGFDVELAGGERVETRKLLLATGLRDDLPDIPGFHELWGHGVHHCPYCDGWENRDRPLAIYGKGHDGSGLALEMTPWSRDLVLCTDGPSELDDHGRERLDRNGIGLIEDPVERLEGGEDGLEAVHFATGRVLPRRALFLMLGPCTMSPLVKKLGCELTEKGAVETYAYEKSNIPGVYVAGDASRRVNFAIVAAAEGAMAAFSINTELLKADTA